MFNEAINPESWGTCYWVFVKSEHLEFYTDWVLGCNTSLLATSWAKCTLFMLRNLRKTVLNIFRDQRCGGQGGWRLTAVLCLSACFGNESHRLPVQESVHRSASLFLLWYSGDAKSVCLIELLWELKWVTHVACLVVQWLRFHPCNVGGLGLIRDQGTRSQMLQLKIPHAATKDSTCCNKYWKCLMLQLRQGTAKEINRYCLKMS